MRPLSPHFELAANIDGDSPETPARLLSPPLSDVSRRFQIIVVLAVKRLLDLRERLFRSTFIARAVAVILVI